jgi:NADH-quinone oxidoreductase subunit M
MSSLARPLPIAAGFLLFFAFGSLGLPGLSGFVGEFLSLLGIFEYSRWLAAVGALGVILAAAYLLWMFQRTMFNDRGDDEVKPSFGLKDLGPREIVSLVPLVVFVIWLGVYPQTFLEFLHVPVQLIIHRVTPSLHDTSASVQSLAQLFHFTKGLF